MHYPVLSVIVGPFKRRAGCRSVWHGAAPKPASAAAFGRATVGRG